MKKITTLLIVICLSAFPLMAEVLSVDPEATPKPIRITVEGVPDSRPTSLTTQKDVFFKNELFKPAPTAVPAADIKKMADNNAMEGEIIDAIIAKLADMEEEMKMQRIINMRLMAGAFAMLLLILFLALRRKK